MSCFEKIISVRIDIYEKGGYNKHRGGVTMKKNWLAVLSVICIFLAAVLFTVGWLMCKEEKVNTALNINPLIVVTRGLTNYYLFFPLKNPPRSLGGSGGGLGGLAAAVAGKPRRSCSTRPRCSAERPEGVSTCTRR